MEEQMNTVKLGLIATTMSVALAGCGGGGGGTVIPSGPTPFTSYSAITLPSTIKMTGSSQEIAYTYDPITGNLLSVGAPSNFAGGGSVTASIDATGTTTSETIVSALGTTVPFDAAKGDLIGIPQTGSIFNAATSSLAAALSPTAPVYILYGVDRALLARPWNYQNFGLWMTDLKNGTGTIGVMTAGAESPGAAIPLTGAALFSGKAGGFYNDPIGGRLLVQSDMFATVDFATRSIGFVTANSTASQIGLVNYNFVPDAGLNLSGTLSYAQGVNQFSGVVASTLMNGTASGRFYGPNATEIGGTFAVAGAGGAYIGGFGGIR